MANLHLLADTARELSLRLNGSLAYEFARYMLETRLDWCPEESASGTLLGEWLLWNTCEAPEKEDVNVAWVYLKDRGLLRNHPDHFDWIVVADESEATR